MHNFRTASCHEERDSDISTTAGANVSCGCAPCATRVYNPRLSTTFISMNFLIWLQDGALGTWVAGSIRGYPMVLACHALGMAAVAGTATMICIRVLGFARAVPVSLFSRLSAIAWAGLILNVVTGLALFSGDPLKFFYLPVFWLKLSLVTMGAASLWLVVRALPGAASLPEAGPGTPAGARLVAGCSLAFWAGAIIAGRLIAYIEFGNGM